MSLNDRLYSGDDFAVGAQEFNTIRASAQDYYSRVFSSRSGRGPGKTIGFNGIVTIRNDSGYDCNRFDVLAISDILISPESNEDLFYARPMFSCGLPSSESTRVVVAQHPIGSGDCGSAMIQGMSAVRIDMQSESDEYATPTDSDMTMLTSATSGPFRILYAESGTGEKRGVVLFPASSSASVEKRYFEITAAEGTSPPFLYSAVERSWNSTTHEFGTKTGGVTITGDLRSIQEQGGYPWAAKLPVGAVVDAWQEGSDWLCEVVYYKGVYPG